MGVTDPEGDSVTITVTGVTQDEPVTSTGDGHTSPDAVIQARAASVRTDRDRRRPALRLDRSVGDVRSPCISRAAAEAALPSKPLTSEPHISRAYCNRIRRCAARTESLEAFFPVAQSHRMDPGRGSLV